MLSHIRDRKLVQWLIAYAVAAWVGVQVLDIVSEGFGWSEVPLRIAIILAVVGAPVVAVLGWYHGEQGRQRVSTVEAFMLGGLTMTAAIALAAFGRPASVGDPPLPPRGEAAMPELDSARYAVLPFRRSGLDHPAVEEEILLHDALGRWRGIELVDFFQVRDAAEGGDGGLDERAAGEIARQVGAGRFITGGVAAVPAGVRLHAVLYDTRSTTRMADTTVLLPGPSGFSDSTAAAIASYLLFRGAGAPDGGEDIDPATTSFEARLAYLKGREALQHWDLDLADSLFQAALADDPAYGLAHLWRSQVRNWNGEDARAMRTSVEIAVAAGDRLPQRERFLARALHALARQDYTAACAAYDSLRQQNELDFAAWYGLGECRRRDDGVVRDPSSPTGWAFRSSHYRAAAAFERAFEILPLAHRGFRSATFERVKELLHVSSAKNLQGRAVAPDSGIFMARPALRGDTLAFFPLRLTDFQANAEGSRPATHWRAVERQRAAFARLAEGWVSAFPRSVPALRALALARELNGEPESLTLLRNARLLTSDSAQRLEIMADEIRLFVKLAGAGAYARAAALADTLLGAPPSLIDPRHLAEIAALTGRATRAATHAGDAATAAPWTITIPAALMRTAEELLAYAALGGPTERIRTAEAVVIAALRNRMPPDVVPGLRRYLLDRPASLAFMTHPLASTSELAAETTYPVLEAQGRLAMGDAAGALRVIRQTHAQRQQQRLRPSQITIETVFPEAWVLFAAGAPDEAAAVLDATLEGLRWAEPGYLGDVSKAASLVRAMALRAEVALARGEPDIARTWAAAVATLWHDCDPHLRPTRDRMNQIASTRRSSIPSY